MAVGEVGERVPVGGGHRVPAVADVEAEAIADELVVRRHRGVGDAVRAEQSVDAVGGAQHVELAEFALAFLLAPSAAAAVRRVLYVTTTAGYRHDSIQASVDVMQDVARQSGVLEIVHTEDLSYITANRLRDFDAVYFFTSGELA